MKVLEKLRCLMPWRRSQRPAIELTTNALERHIDELVERFFADPLGDQWLGGGWWSPGVAVRETRDGVEIRVGVRGMMPGDLKVEVRRDAVVIHGQTRSGGDRRSRAGRMSEQSSTELHHSVALPAGLDPTRAEAQVRRGVLTIRLPRTEGQEYAGRRIPVC